MEWLFHNLIRFLLTGIKLCRSKSSKHYECSGYAETEFMDKMFSGKKTKPDMSSVKGLQVNKYRKSCSENSLYFKHLKNKGKKAILLMYFF